MIARPYIRVSTEEQAAEGYSLQAQERACRLYAELQQASGVVVYTDDGYSGTRADRPAFERLLAEARKGDMVLVHKLDRFARNTPLLLDTLNGFEQRGVRFISVTEQIDFSSPIGKVMLTLLAAFAQYYVDNLRAETSKGHREKAQKGLWVGPVPFGYCKLDRGRISPDSNAETVQLIYRLYVEDGLSYDLIAAELRRRGLSSPKKEWGRENVRTILRNPAYAGLVSSGGVSFAGVHPTLVSRETWEAVAARREERSIKPRSTPAPPQPKYREVMYCARCGSRLWVKSSSKLGTPSYVCSQRRKCKSIQVVADTVEAQVSKLLRLIVVPDDAYQSAIERVEVDNGEVIRVVGKGKHRELLAVLGEALHARI